MHIWIIAIIVTDRTYTVPWSENLHDLQTGSGIIWNHVLSLTCHHRTQVVPLQSMVLMDSWGLFPAHHVEPGESWLGDVSYVWCVSGVLVFCAPCTVMRRLQVAGCTVCAVWSQMAYCCIFHLFHACHRFHIIHSIHWRPFETAWEISMYRDIGDILCILMALDGICRHLLCFGLNGSFIARMWWCRLTLFSSPWGKRRTCVRKRMHLASSGWACTSSLWPRQLVLAPFPASSLNRLNIMTQRPQETTSTEYPYQYQMYLHIYSCLSIRHTDRTNTGHCRSSYDKHSTYCTGEYLHEQHEVARWSWAVMNIMKPWWTPWWWLQPLQWHSIHFMHFMRFMCILRWRTSWLQCCFQLLLPPIWDSFQRGIRCHRTLPSASWSSMEQLAFWRLAMRLGHSPKNSVCWWRAIKRKIRPARPGQHS